MARKRTYRTNKGKTIDMEAMRTANEKTIATGNMSVNAKGDVVRRGKIVKTAKERATVRHQTIKQTTQASLKRPLDSKETKVNPEPIPEPTPIEEAELTVETIRTRDDGSKYKEVMTPDGDIDIVELDPPEEPVEEAPKKKKKKKSSGKKKPTV